MNQLHGVIEKPYEPPPTNGNGNGHHKKRSLKPLPFKWMSEVSPKPVKWFWENFIPVGMFTLLQGEEGLGKSWISYALAAACSTGGYLPESSQPIEQGTCLLLTTEDNDEYTIVPRLISLGASRERIAHVADSFPLDEDGALRLEMLLADIRPRLVVVDPLTSFLSGNANDEVAVRPALEHLNELARKYDCAIVGVQHLNKSKGGGDERRAGNGTIAFRAVSRSVLLVGKDPDNPRKKALCQIKSNVGEICPFSVGFEIERAEIEVDGMTISAGSFYWTGKSDLAAKQMLAAASSSDDEDAAGASEAVTFLRETLALGEKSVAEVLEEGKALGLTERQLRYARQKLGVKPKKRGGFFGKMFGQNWSWSLPEDDKPEDDCHLQQNAPKQRTYSLSRAEGDKPSSHTGVDCRLQPNPNNNSFETDPLAEGDNAGKDCHLQHTGNRLFETRVPRLPANNSPKTCPCVKCGKIIGVNDEVCPACGADNTPPF